jgi:hypothetical protein
MFLSFAPGEGSHVPQPTQEQRRRIGKGRQLAARATARTPANARAIAGALDVSRRRENLSWSHRVEVAAIEVAAQAQSGRSVPQKIRDFLVRRQGRTYCDTCIQEQFGLKWRQHVRLITATLAVTESFKRDLGRCCTCHEPKKVIHAV